MGKTSGKMAAGAAAVITGTCTIVAGTAAAGMGAVVTAGVGCFIGQERAWQRYGNAVNMAGRCWVKCVKSVYGFVYEKLATAIDDDVSERLNDPETVELATGAIDNNPAYTEETKEGMRTVLAATVAHNVADRTIQLVKEKHDLTDGQINAAVDLAQRVWENQERGNRTASQEMGCNSAFPQNLADQPWAPAAQPTLQHVGQSPGYMPAAIHAAVPPIAALDLAQPAMYAAPPVPCSVQHVTQNPGCMSAAPYAAAPLSAAPAFVQPAVPCSVQHIAQNAGCMSAAPHAAAPLLAVPDLPQFAMYAPPVHCSVQHLRHQTLPSLPCTQHHRFHAMLSAYPKIQATCFKGR